MYASLALVGCLVLMVVVLNYPAAGANTGVMLTQNNWTVRSSTDSEGIHMPFTRGNNVTARFGKDGRMTGNVGCNGYAVLFMTKDYTINLSLESVTEMACWDPGIRVQESAFLSDLSHTESFRLSESSLVFYDASGKKVPVFVPV